MHSMKPEPYGVITHVAPRSAAARAGLRAGDRLLQLNGHSLRDVIDVQIYAAEPELSFLIEREGERLTRHVRRRYGEDLGLSFAQPLFDGSVRVCQNACDFCFVTQMPPGMRPTLYVKDDDYRLSFLQGTYITLTNLRPADWERIADQFLSPLYVSVHATDPAVRVGLMHNPRSGRIMEDLRRLTRMGIRVHTQAVLVPGRNDGAQLDRTISDLASLYPGVATLAVVPVGLTRYHHPDCRPYTDAEAVAVLDQVLHWQEVLSVRLGTRFVYPSDEWYLRARRPLPPTDAYEAWLPAFIENGVGLTRLVLDRWELIEAGLRQAGGPRQTWVTGTLFAPMLRELAGDFARRTGLTVDVIAATNHTFGETVTVAGLLALADVERALQEQEHEPGQVVILPAAMFRGPEGRSLDGFTPEEAASRWGRPVWVHPPVETW